MTRWARIMRDEILEFKLQVYNEIQFMIIVYQMFKLNYVISYLSTSCKIDLENIEAQSVSVLHVECKFRLFIIELGFKGGEGIRTPIYSLIARRRFSAGERMTALPPHHI